MQSVTYPLNMEHPGAGGYAVANTEDEHRALSDQGYEPAWAESEEAYLESVDSLRAALDAAGIAYDKRWGVAKLKTMLPGAPEGEQG